MCSFFFLQFELTQDIGDVFKIRLGIIDPPKEENEEKDNSSNKKKDKKKEEKEPAKEEEDENKQKMYSWYLEQVKELKQKKNCLENTVSLSNKSVDNNYKGLFQNKAVANNSIISRLNLKIKIREMCTLVWWMIGLSWMM